MTKLTADYRNEDLSMRSRVELVLRELTYPGDLIDCCMVCELLDAEGHDRNRVSMALVLLRRAGSISIVDCIAGDEQGAPIHIYETEDNLYIGEACVRHAYKASPRPRKSGYHIERDEDVAAVRGD